jgi:hypothetical protein
MTIFPLLNGDSRSADYLTLDEALGRGLVHITEVTVQGSVPELKLANDADQPVLLLDGEELIGAKQNRVPNLTIIAPPKRTIIIAVFCVEAGRWSPRSAKSTTSSNAYFSQGRAKKMTQVSSSLDSIDTNTKKAAATSREVEELLLEIAQAEAKTFPACDDGVDVRFTGPNLTGAGLIVNGGVVHLSAFRTAQGQWRSECTL